MNGVSLLLMGVGLGFRHATDADHVAVVATLLERQPGPVRAAKVAALWGLGHSAAFFGIGLPVVLTGARIPPGLERAAELLVAAMLITLGLVHLRRARHVPAASRRDAGSSGSTRLVAVGLVHGLSGSAGIAILATTAIASRPMAVAYLGLFGLGTVLGMIALTMALSWPIGWALRRPGLAPRLTTATASLLSLGLGLVMLIDGLGDGS